MRTFSEAYQKTLDFAPSVDGALLAEEYVARVEQAIEKAKEDLDTMAHLNINKGADFLKGDLAEPYHAGTFNADVVAKGGQGIKAVTPRATRGDDRKVDVRIQRDDGTELSVWQSKYYKSAEETAKAISHPDYEGMGKVGPKDQIEAIKSISRKEHLRNIGPRPDQARQYGDTEQNISDVIREGEYSSKAIAEDEIKQMAQDYKNGKELDAKKYRLVVEEFVRYQDILREAGNAALHAAVLTAALKALPELYKIVNQALVTGNIDTEDLKDAGLSILSSGLEGSLRGGIAATILISCRTGLLGSSLRTVSPEFIGVATAVAMNAIHNGIGLASGRITQAEFVEACIRDMVVAGMGLGGAYLFQSVIPIPILGALIGNFIGTSIGGFAVAGVEKVFLSFFVEKGYTFFGLVKQDYRLPEGILEQIGVETIHLDCIDFETIAFDTISFETISYEEISLELIDYSFLKRGLIGVNRVGYV